MLQGVRILLTTPYDLSVPSGVNSQARGLRDYLRRATAARVLLVGPASDPCAETDSDTLCLGRVSRLPMNGAISNLTFDRSIKGEVRSLLRRFDPDIVHLQEVFAPLLNTYVLKYSRAFNAATFHTCGANHLGYALAWPYLRYQLRRVDLRIAVSAAARRYAERLFPGAYRTVPNAIEPAAAPAAAPWPPDRKTILFVGRASEARKGFRHLLGAYRLLEERSPGEYRLVVAGPGGRQPTRGDVRWVGRVGDEALQALYAGCDLFCAPSTGGESFGLVLLEAFAHGKPAICSDIEGYAELAGDHGAALLFPPGDEQALAGAIARLGRDARLRADMGRRAKSLASRFSWDQVGGQIVNHYRNALGNGGRRP